MILTFTIFSFCIAPWAVKSWIIANLLNFTFFLNKNENLSISWKKRKPMGACSQNFKKKKVHCILIVFWIPVLSHVQFDWYLQSNNHLLSIILFSIVGCGRNSVSIIIQLVAKNLKWVKINMNFSLHKVYTRNWAVVLDFM